MLKLSLKQFRVYWVGYIGTIITLIATGVIGMISTELLGSAIIDAIHNGATEKSSGAIAMFGSSCGFLITLAIASLVMSINYSIRRRDASFANLRIIGTNYKSVRKMIFYESNFMTLLSLVISVPIGVVLSSPVLQHFKDIGGVPETVNITWNYALILICSGIVILIVSLLSVFLSKKLKNINIYSSKSVDSLGSKRKIIFNITLGLILIILPIILFNQISLEGGRAQMYMTIALFVPVIGFAISGKYIFHYLLLFLSKVFKKFPSANYFILAFRHSLSKIINVTTSIAFIVVFQAVLTTTNVVLAESKVIATRELYEGLNTYKIKDGIDVNDVYNDVHTNNPMAIYDIKGEYVKKDKDGDKPSYKSGNFEMVRGKFIYNFKDNDKKVINKDEVVLTSDYPMYDSTNIGSKINLKINGIDREYTVKSKVRSLLTQASMTSIYIGYDSSLEPLSKFRDIISKDEISNDSRLIKSDSLLFVQRQNVASTEITKLIQTIVIVFSIINILNFLLLFMYDKRAEMKLRNVLGESPRAITISMLLQTLATVIIGILIGLYSTLTFTVPYLADNPATSGVISNPSYFIWMIFAIIIISLTFAYLVIKISNIKKPA